MSLCSRVIRMDVWSVEDISSTSVTFNTTSVFLFTQDMNLKLLRGVNASPAISSFWRKWVRYCTGFCCTYKMPPHNPFTFNRHDTLISDLQKLTSEAKTIISKPLLNTNSAFSNTANGCTWSDHVTLGS